MRSQILLLLDEVTVCTSLKKVISIVVKHTFFRGYGTSGLDIDELVSDFSRFYILTILYEGPAHGYSILTRFRKRVKKDITPSIVYPFLQLLEQKGFLKYTVKPVGKRQRKVYELTEEGRKLCTMLFKRFAALVSTAIEPSLNVCANCGCKVYEGGHVDIIDGKEAVFCCRHCAESYKMEREKHTHLA